MPCSFADRQSGNALQPSLAHGYSARNPSYDQPARRVLAARRHVRGTRVCRRTRRRARAGRVRHRRRAARAVARGDLPLGEAVEIDPTYAAAHNNLAIGYEHEGQFDKARQAYEKAIEARARTTCRSGRTTSSSRKSMTARSNSERRNRSLALAAVAVAALAAAALRRQLLRDPDRDADPAEARRLAVPARADRRLRRRRHRRRGRQPGDGAAAAQPAALEVVAAGHRRRRDGAASRSRRIRTSRRTRPEACWRLGAGDRSRSRGAAAAAARRHQEREGPRGLRAAVREHGLLEGGSARSIRTR